MSLIPPAWGAWDVLQQARACLPLNLRVPPLLIGPDGSLLLAESLQLTGSYKIRAAFHMLGLYRQRQQAAGLPEGGVALASSGNFAAAFAFAGRQLGISVSVVMMHKSSSFKADMASAWGARIVRCGDHIDDRVATLHRLGEDEGLLVIDHLEDPDVVVGHATLGVDLVHSWQRPKPPATVLVPVSTAGLAAGVALAVKQRFPDCRVIGIQAAGSDAAVRSFRSREVVTLERVETECDALTANRPGGLPFQVCLDWLEDIVCVSEEAVRAAVVELLTQGHLLVEPGGAVGYAAIRQGLVRGGESCCAILSGGNLEPERLMGFLRSPSTAAELPTFRGEGNRKG